MLTQARETAFIATLGTEPQVVTVTLDLLIEEYKLTFDEVVIIHTAPDVDRIRVAIDILKGEFAGGVYRQHVRGDPRFMLLQVEGRPIRDIYTEPEAGAVFTILYREVIKHKRLHRIVHLNAAGGRKGMMIFGMATAQLLFDDDDHLWLLSSTDEFTTSRALHRRSPTEARLIPIPVLRWSLIPQTFTTLILHDDPFQAINYQRSLLDLKDRARKEEFLQEVLTRTEAKIAETLVREPYRSRDELARDMHYSRKFIDKYLTEIYRKLQEHFGLREGNREMLIFLFAPYFEWRDRTQRT